MVNFQMVGYYHLKLLQVGIHRKDRSNISVFFGQGNDSGYWRSEQNFFFEHVLSHMSVFSDGIRDS